VAVGVGLEKPRKVSDEAIGLVFSPKNVDKKEGNKPTITFKWRGSKAERFKEWGGSGKRRQNSRGGRSSIIKREGSKVIHP